MADFNLVAAMFGDGGISRVVYTLVGFAALIVLYTELMMVRAADKPGIRRPAVQA